MALRTIGAASLFVLAGAFVLGALRRADIDFGSPWLAAYALGFALLVAGPLFVWRRLLRVMGKERVLTIHEDGLRWQEGDATPRFVGWSALAEVAIAGAVLVVAGGGERWELPLPFEGASAEHVVGLCRELQQKALLGLRVRPREIAARETDRYFGS